MNPTTTPGTQVVAGELHRVRRGHGKRFSAEPPPQLNRRPAHVAVMLALAHTIQRAIERGEIKDQAEAARRLGVTRARLTQILDLTLLPPALQEELLFLEATDGVEPLSERALRDSKRLAFSSDIVRGLVNSRRSAAYGNSSLSFTKYRKSNGRDALR